MLGDTSDEGGGVADEPGSFSLLILELLRQVGFRGATIPNLKVI